MHEKGARHLADPSRLMASARMVYGDALDVLFGELAAVPADRLRHAGRRRARWTWATAAAWRATTRRGTPSTTWDCSTRAAATCTSATRRACTSRRPATCGRPRRHRTSTSRWHWPRSRQFTALDPSRLLFSHYGPVSDVPGTLERSAEEISVWVSETRAARSAGMDLDHAVEAVRQRTLSRYAAFGVDADPVVKDKFEQISGAEANVGGIWHWLDKLDSAGRRMVLRGVIEGGVSPSSRCRLRVSPGSSPAGALTYAGYSGFREGLPRLLAGGRGFARPGRAFGVRLACRLAPLPRLRPRRHRPPRLRLRRSSSSSSSSSSSGRLRRPRLRRRRRRLRRRRPSSSSSSPPLRRRRLRHRRRRLRLRRRRRRRRRRLRRPRPLLGRGC